MEVDKYTPCSNFFKKTIMYLHRSSLLALIFRKKIIDNHTIFKFYSNKVDMKITNLLSLYVQRSYF